MNNLQKLLVLRGMSAKAVSDRIGAGYHITQKTILGRRHGRNIQDRIAHLLGLSHDEVWGDNADQALLALIRREVKKQVKKRSREDEKEQLRRWLQGGNVPKKRAGGNV